MVEKCLVKFKKAFSSLCRDGTGLIWKGVRQIKWKCQTTRTTTLNNAKYGGSRGQNLSAPFIEIFCISRYESFKNLQGKNHVISKKNGVTIREYFYIQCSVPRNSLAFSAAQYFFRSMKKNSLSAKPFQKIE